MNIRTAFNHPIGQHREGRYFLDGYDSENRTAYEFLGCVGKRLNYHNPTNFTSLIELANSFQFMDITSTILFVRS